MKHKKQKSGFKYFGLLLLAGLFLYAALMIVIRLGITEMAYQFDELKNYERSLKEEQLHLRAKVSQKLSPGQLKSEMEAQGYLEPQPHQVMVIP